MNYNDFARDIFCKIENKMSVVAERSVNIIADGCDTHGRYRDCRGTYWWTNGFFGGLNLLLYNETKKECYLKCAESSEMRLDFALENEIDELHHDVGFMWHILSGAKHRLLGDGASRTRNLYAASLLASRFILGGGFIEAWNGRGAENITIIDTLMNLPLLYWASREISNDRYKRIAMAHADAAIKTHLRPDGSVAHIVEHDRESGEVIRTFGGQGYAEGSAWSRGSAWAIYGFMLSYIHTGEERYLKAAVSAADYFISGISQDGTVPAFQIQGGDNAVIALHIQG